MIEEIETSVGANIKVKKALFSAFFVLQFNKGIYFKVVKKIKIELCQIFVDLKNVLYGTFFKLFLRLVE